MLNLFGFVMHVYVHSEDKFEVSFYNCCLCLVDLLTGRGFILMSILCVNVFGYDNRIRVPLPTCLYLFGE